MPAMLDAVGLLGGRVLAAHGVQLSDADVALLAARGVAVAHCPGSNAKLAAGVARVTALRRAGVRVGLGTDGPASGDDLDLWAQARLAGLLARVGAGDAAALTAAELLLMATRDGAAAIGRPDLGVLEAGAWADLVHVDLDDPAFADPADDAQLLSNLVWAGGARLVTDVWVAGEAVLVGGEPTRVDRAATTAGLRAVAARAPPLTPARPGPGGYQLAAARRWWRPVSASASRPGHSCPTASTWRGVRDRSRPDPVAAPARSVARGRPLPRRPGPAHRRPPAARFARRHVHDHTARHLRRLDRQRRGQRVAAEVLHRRHRRRHRRRRAAAAPSCCRRRHPPRDRAAKIGVWRASSSSACLPFARRPSSNSSITTSPPLGASATPNGVT